MLAIMLRINHCSSLFRAHPRDTAWCVCYLLAFTSVGCICAAGTASYQQCALSSTVAQPTNVDVFMHVTCGCMAKMVALAFSTWYVIRFCCTEKICDPQ